MCVGSVKGWLGDVATRRKRRCGLLSGFDARMTDQVGDHLTVGKVNSGVLIALRTPPVLDKMHTMNVH